jgi:hypothetical protein
VRAEKPDWPNGLASEYSLELVCRGGSAMMPEWPDAMAETLAAARRNAGSDNSPA